MTKALFMQQNLQAGEIYAGLVLGRPGEHDHHVIVLPGDPEPMNFADAKAWAASIGGDLPCRREQRILFANAKEHFKETWYWSNTQHAYDSDCAWLQNFGYGGQLSDPKSSKCRARAVRRLILL